MNLILHIDGASRGNPGPAAVGIAITDERGASVAKIGEYIGETTNNVAEYQALVRGMQEAVALGAQEIQVFGDSQLVIKQMKGEYKVRHPNLLPLYHEARSLTKLLRCVSFNYIPRSKNTCADKLANIALDDEKKKESTAACTSKPVSMKESSQAVLEQQSILEVPQLALSQVFLPAGQELMDRDNNADTFIFVLSGQGTCVIDEKKRSIRAKEAVFAPQRTFFSIRATPKGSLTILRGRIPTGNVLPKRSK